jgi:hypothetical protein
VLLTFNDTGTGDEKQLRAADGDVLDGKGHLAIIKSGYKVSQVRSCRERGGDGAVERG